MEKYNGYLVKKYKDNNVYSVTYGSEKTDMEYNPTICPPDSPAPTPTPTVKKTQTITWKQDIDELYVDESIELVATASSNLPISFSIQDGSTLAHIDGNILYADKEGGIVVVANQSGNDEYYAADTVLKAINVKSQPTPIEKKEQTITWAQDVELKVGDTITLNATASSGLSVSYGIVSGGTYVTLNGNVLTATAEGDVVIRAYQSGNDEYKSATPIDKSIRVEKKEEPKPTKKEQNITWEQEINVKVGDTITLNATASSGLEVAYSIVYGNDKATLSGNTLTFVSEGSVMVNATQSGNDEYDAAATVQKTFTISAKQISSGGGELVLVFDKTLYDYETADDKTFSVMMEQNGTLTELWGSDDLAKYLDTFSTNEVTKVIPFDKPSGDVTHKLLWSRTNDNHSKMIRTIKEAYFQTVDDKLIDFENVKVFYGFCELRNATISFKTGLGKILTNTSNIESVEMLFLRNNKIENAYLDNMDLSSVNSYYALFNNCEKLSYINLDNTKLNVNPTDTEYMFYNTGKLVDAVTISMKGSTEEERIFIKNMWVACNNDENKLTILT